MPSRSANSRSDRARPAASSSNHARPRAIALINVGSHRERSFWIATSGSTSLISTPRRLKAIGAASSIGLSLGLSDEGCGTAPPDSAQRRILIVIAFSPITTVSMRSRTTLARSASERLRARCEASCSIDHFPGLVAGYAGVTDALEQHCRAGQRVGQDPDNSVFDFLGWQPPALSVVRSGLGDQGSGDIVAIASTFLDGVRWGEPLALGIDQHAHQQAWLGGIGSASMVRRVCSEPVPRGGPGLGVDQRWMLPGVELALVCNLTDVDRVREQLIEVPPRERLAASLGAVRCRAALRPEPQAIGLFLDPAHAAELAITGEDAAHGLRLGRVDDKRVIAERYVAAHPHALLLRGGDLVADPFAGNLALELGKGQQHIERQPPHRA